MSRRSTSGRAGASHVVVQPRTDEHCVTCGRPFATMGGPHPYPHGDTHCYVNCSSDPRCLVACLTVALGNARSESER